MSSPRKSFTVWLFYLTALLLFVIVASVLLSKGKTLEIPETISSIHTEHSSFYHQFLHTTRLNILEPAAMLFLQIISILLVSRLFSWLFAKIGQPTVIGEILAGIALGPSLLGMFFPDVYNFLFAANSLPNLYILSQIGLVLFMFTVGMELDISLLKSKMSSTFVLSNMSVLIPYILGMVLAYVFYEEFAASHTAFLSFSLFIGISLSITAFPVLARIIQEKGITKTHTGAISLAAAAFNDVAAWCMLAVVIAVAQTGSFGGAIFNIILSILYVVVMLLVLKPFLRKLASVYKNVEVVNKSIFGFIIFVLIVSAYVSHIIGIHIIFGAFLAGAIMPPFTGFRRAIIGKVEDISLSLFLPLFFVYTGLRTQIGLLNTVHLWEVCGLFVLVAVVGKFAGSAFTAKFLGESWKDSLSIGVLMNTRGLMELVVLNIGYEMNILSPEIFVILFIMTLITTFMTTPLLSLINHILPDKKTSQQIHKQVLGVFKTLIAMGNPENGAALLGVAKYILGGERNILSINVLHITQGFNLNPIIAEKYATESFAQITQASELLAMPIGTIHRNTENIEQDIVQEVNYRNYDFLLVGAGISLSEDNAKNHNFNSRLLNNVAKSISRSQVALFPGELIKDKTKYFIEHSTCSVGVFVNRGFKEISTTLILLYQPSDYFLLRYAKRLLNNSSQSSVFIIDINGCIQSDQEIRSSVDELQTTHSRRFKVLKTKGNSESIFIKFSFMLVSYQAWNALLKTDENLLTNIPSTLIINKKSSRFTTR
ncbi:MAG: cation:proton antiporter [Paludibacter sp.]|jgi:Kef-type K+ transport system membrane component KefB|nr:cation:proton antiporter [Paludibacter sp.]